jgi:phospholipid/cholesterol/gamma-HCH transport system permease protein
MDGINLNMNKTARIVYEKNALLCEGSWLTDDLTQLSNKLNTWVFTPSSPSVLDVSSVTRIDSAGLWLLSKLILRAKAQGVALTVIGLSTQQSVILDNIIQQDLSAQTASQKTSLTPIEALGQQSIFLGQLALSLISFIGEITLGLFHWIMNIHKIRWKAISHHIYSTGLKASGIIALLSFLIGLVLAYQVGNQLETYGASIYIVDLLGISLLREFSPLLTAIIVAGRSGSAFAAQIGTMKLNEEVDALRTLGLSPTEVLVLPKVLGLLIALPLLTILAMCFSVFGGIVMSKIMLGISPADFLHRFGSVIHLKTLLLGEIKTPVFAMLIASIGCFQGFLVTNSAASVGERTTISVVQSIFMIIVADALFSIIYSALGV